MAESAQPVAYRLCQARVSLVGPGEIALLLTILKRSGSTAPVLACQWRRGTFDELAKTGSSPKSRLEKLFPKPYREHRVKRSDELEMRTSVKTRVRAYPVKNPSFHQNRRRFAWDQSFLLLESCDSTMFARPMLFSRVVWTGFSRFLQ